MRIALLFATVSALALGHSAHADGPPSHVKIAQCSPVIRQTLLTIVGHPLTIAFPEGESAWYVPLSGKIGADQRVDPKVEGVKPDDLNKMPIRNMITLWPDEPGTFTATVIAQTKSGGLRTYPFTLTAISDDADALNNPNVTLNLLCQDGPISGPKPVVATTPVAPGAMRVTPVVAARRLPLSAAERLEAEEKLRTEAFNGSGDQPCHYHAKGKHPSTVEPMCPMDNGEWTLIRFKGLTRKPAVYIGACEDGNDEERLARQHGAGDFVVVEEIAKQFCLRLGSNQNDVLEIINDQFDPEGKDPGTSTLTPAVRRDLIWAKTH